LRCGVDGNGDNKVNLFNVDDAIFSVGNYLKTYGWGPSLEEQRKAVFGYNNSDDYVNAILSLMNKTIQYNRLKVPIEEQVQDTP
jgi:membrane-bound lytic murein transglycosylase B